MSSKNAPPKIAFTNDRYHPDACIPKAEEGSNWIWVFGSNEAGRHGKGAAKVAHVSFKAQYGVGSGLTGKSYAIPTKNRHLVVLPLAQIERKVKEFLEYARTNTKNQFYITRVGCGEAGYSDEVIAPFFVEAPINCCLPEQWKPFMPAKKIKAVSTRTEALAEGISA